MKPKDLSEQIKKGLPDAKVSVIDLTGGGDHFEVEVISSAFEGLSQLQRHRIVHAPLKEVLGGALHALTLHTRTPEESSADAGGGNHG